MASKDSKKGPVKVQDTVKRHRQSLENRARNRHYKSTLRTGIKKLRALIEAGKVDEAKAELSNTVSTIQKVAQKGIIHKSQAARRVSRLAKAVAAAKPKAPVVSGKGR